MQLSERPIAYQIFSFGGYRRLRASLMQQADLFKLVVTEADLDEVPLDGKVRWLEAIAQLINQVPAPSPAESLAEEASRHGQATDASEPDGDQLGAQSVSGDPSEPTWKCAFGDASSDDSAKGDRSDSRPSSSNAASDVTASDVMEPLQMLTQSLHQLGRGHDSSSDGRSQDFSWDGKPEEASSHLSSLYAEGSLSSDGVDAANFSAVQQAFEVGEQKFVLMCSPALNVLLTSTPVKPQPSSAALASPTSAVSAKVSGSKTDKQQTPQKDVAFNKQIVPEQRPARRDLGRRGANQRANQYTAAGDDFVALPLDGVDYRVGLTFDNGAIAAFLSHVKLSVRRLVAQQAASHTSKTHASGSAVSTAPASGYQGSGQQGAAFLSSPLHSFYKSFHKVTQGGPQMSHSQDSVAASESEETHNRSQVIETTSANERMLAQKAFVLSWAKDLATSPDGDPQPTKAALDNQIEQSLLLDQVITRIRHSLDLPAILETTVAQVREFLSADRLVLYQLDQFEPVVATNPDLDAPGKDSAKEASARKGSEEGSCGPEDFLESPRENLKEGPANPLKVAQRVHPGHVTYESRLDTSISSVLDFSEEACFVPDKPIESRYLNGQPIAVNNIDQQYAHVPCLLDFLHKANIKSKIIAPIIVQNRLWGLLIAHQCGTYRHWEKTEVVFLQHIAEHLAVAIAQASLYQQVRDQTISLKSCVIERTQNLHDALVAAESADITKGEFLSTMSHELRTPLTYIIGMSATLLRWSFGELNQRQRSYLNTINQSGEQLLEIINNILEFAQLESGRSLLEFGDFSLQELIDDIVREHQTTANKRDVALTCDFKVSVETDTFRADFNRLKQIVSNLVDNAIKFTPAGGTVKLRIWREAESAVFQVEDSGIGIPDSQRDVLFETFKQLESPFQRQYAGTGLGLAMTKRLVELHGGLIHVESEVGKGSIFSVRLPMQMPMAHQQRYQVPVTLENTAERIILLEKDEDSAAIVCEMLTAAGYEVIWLISADQLANQLEILRPIMLVADLSLLGQDLEKVKDIQLSVASLNAKVLALMAQQDAVLSPVAHHDILHKPVDPKLLVEKVRQLTVRRG